jgi:hypothetical protein
MALGPSEQWIGGFVKDTSGPLPALSITYSTAGAQWWGGFLRDPDGRLVVVDG